MNIRKVLMKTTAFIMCGILGLLSPIGENENGFQSKTVMAAKIKSVADYQYKITPLLSPFNEYFFVKTNNPDPTSFRFLDKSTTYGNKYDKKSTISLEWDIRNKKVILYADIKYENVKTGRVNGGYIFRGTYTDGGQVVLQEKNNDWNPSWKDTNIKIKLPALKDDVDYLIDTYATKNSFFENMDAVQSGFSSICLYSGSNIRGKLVRSNDYWSITNSPHVDQIFYIISPYEYKDSELLFASTLYPYLCDSVGFPWKMAEVAQRLDSASSIRRSDSSHAHINVTYAGEMRTYGGEGTGEGQSISKDKIKKYLEFGANGTEITLASLYQLLGEYSKVKMDDDIPRNDVLTWKNIYDTVGTGAWVHLSNRCYSYIYRRGDGSKLWGEEFGAGNNIYFGGDLGYGSDTWVDGRYIGKYECYIPGERFENHPTSSILLNDIKIPKVTYDCEYEYSEITGKIEEVYSNVHITEQSKTVMFYYDKSENIWKADNRAFNNGNRYERIKELVEKGVIVQKYLDEITLTMDEVKALKVDRNTDCVPTSGYLYDGTTKPGTPYIAQPLTNAKVIVSGATYTRELKKPTVKVMLDGKILKNETDYTITYDDYNISPGIAKLTITGEGAYIGKIEKTYKIKPETVTLLGQVGFSSKSTIIMTWMLADGVTGYEVYRATSRKGKYTKVGTTSTPIFFDKGLKKGAKFYYKVRAYKTVENEKIYGKFSSVVGMRTKMDDVTHN